MKVFVYCIYILLLTATISNFIAYSDKNFFKTVYSKVINIITPAAATTYLIIVIVRHQRLTRRIKDESKKRRFYENN